MTNSELVVGKLMASLLSVLVMIGASLPIFLLAVLFGGISFGQVLRVFAVTLTTTLAAGSLGTIMAFWREKTFQTLALTALLLCFWLGFWQVVASGILGDSWAGIPSATWATGFSPLLAVVAAARPFLFSEPNLGILDNGVGLYLFISSSMTLLLCAVAVARVRVWNPSREVRQRGAVANRSQSIWGVEQDLAIEKAEQARAGHVDARLRTGSASAAVTREVWDNPILWRELKTWAYGKKILFIRLAYLVLVVMACVAVHVALQPNSRLARDGDELMPATAKPLAPLFLVSLVIVNALAVTSITTERDGQSLDLLLTTDLSPREFMFGKLGGVFSVAGLMIAAPMVISGYFWLWGGLGGENLVFLLLGLLVMNVFVSMLGIHCGMRYANSRTAIAVSLGTVFFLFLGVVACMRMMVSFSSSFEVQMAPFLAFIVGGGVGLYVALGAGNPSKAIAASAIVAPFATFYAITSFLMDKQLSVFLVIAGTYGFTTAAMLIPALYEFDFAMGRSSAADD